MLSCYVWWFLGIYSTVGSSSAGMLYQAIYSFAFFTKSIVLYDVVLQAYLRRKGIFPTLFPPGGCFNQNPQTRDTPNPLSPLLLFHPKPSSPLLPFLHLNLLFTQKSVSPKQLVNPQPNSPASHAPRHQKHQPPASSPPPSHALHQYHHSPASVSPPSHAPHSYPQLRSHPRSCFRSRRRKHRAVRIRCGCLGGKGGCVCGGRGR